MGKNRNRGKEDKTVGRDEIKEKIVKEENMGKQQRQRKNKKSNRDRKNQGKEQGQRKTSLK